MHGEAQAVVIIIFLRVQVHPKITPRGSNSQPAALALEPNPITFALHYVIWSPRTEGRVDLESPASPFETLPVNQLSLSGQWTELLIH